MAGSLQQRIGQARRRLILQLLVNRLAIAWLVALVLGAAWFLLQPWLIADAPAYLRWLVVGSLTGVMTVTAVALTIRATPTHQDVALLLDERFQLSERVTTALNLTEPERHTPAGLALLDDAEKRTAKLVVSSRFPVQLSWPAWLVPVSAAALVLIGLLYQPVTSTVLAETPADDERTAARKADDAEKRLADAMKKLQLKSNERPNKSEALKELETEIEKLLSKIDPQETKPEVAREKVQKLDEMTDKLKKFEKENLEKFAQLQAQMQNLDKLKSGEIKEGPAKDLEEAMNKGDVEKAKKDVDRLRKKLANKELSQAEKEQLSDQMQDLEEKLQQLSKMKDQEDKLKDLIEKAKEAGKDAEGLERELEQLQKDIAENADLTKMAEKMQKVRQALEKGDLDKAAEELKELSDQLGELDDKLQDMEDVREYLQRMKEARKGQCKQCEGQGEGKDGDPKWTKNAKGGGRGMGERPDNPDAQSSSEEQRIRAGFNPLGKKYYGGSTDGPAFTKKSTVEMQGEIQQAAQEAPEAQEVQRLPKAARNMVRDYFERLGDQQNAPKK